MDPLAITFIVFITFLFEMCAGSQGGLFDLEKGPLTAVDAMEIYRSHENIDVLVPDRQSYQQKFKQLLANRRNLKESLANKLAVEYSVEDDSLELIDLEAAKDQWIPPQPDDFQTCGFTSTKRFEFPGSNFRVVGGQSAKEGAWPWMVGLAYVRENSTLLEFHCGGSLVSATHVITAAHCILRPPVTLKAVRLGVTKLTDRSSAIDILVEKAEIHPGFDWRSAKDDIAVLFLAKPVRFTETVHPICLPHGNMEKSNFEKTFPYVTGWGITEDGGPSSWLKEVRLPVVNNGICQKIYKGLSRGKKIAIQESHICCGFLEGGRDACQGDSGGPLMIPTDPHPRGELYVLIGIVSLGEGCARPGIPGVFTRITSYLDWLDSVMSE